MELDLWPAFLARRDIRQLTPESRMFLIELGVAAAAIEDEDLPDGFVPEVVIQYLDWPIEIVERLMTDFVERGWLTYFDSPSGWQINGWLERAVHFTPGLSTTAIPAWGQKPLSKVLTARDNSRVRQQRSRDKRKEAGLPVS
jgi:hypothetical protein